MSEWKQITLGDLAKGIRGVSYRPEHLRSQSSNATTTLLRATNIQGGKLVLDDVQFICSSIINSSQILKAGDITVCMSNGSRDLVGKSALFDFDNGHRYTVGAFCSIFRPHDETDAKFVFHLFNSLAYQQSVDLVLAGSAINNLKNSSIENTVYNIPAEKSFRNKIASILTSADIAIGETESLISKYQQIKAGLMHDLFTRGVLPNGKLRPSRSEAPELYKKTTIGMVPREWEVSGLATKGRSDTTWIRTGPFGSALKGEHWRSSGHPVITIGALGEGVFTCDELLFVEDKDAARLVDFQLKCGDVVFSRVADVGRSVVVRKEQAGWIMSSNLMRIAVDEARARPDFVQLALAGDSRIKAQIRASVNSGGRDVANSNMLNQLRFVWPDISEQDRIIEVINRICQKLEVEQQKAANLRQQKLGLMQDLLTGKVPVKLDEPEPTHA